MTKKQMEKLIPHDTYYCHNDKGIACPHLQILIIDRKDYPKTLTSSFGYPEHYLCKDKNKIQVEYCHYLQSFLEVQDMVKDCNVSCPEDDFEEEGNTISMTSGDNEIELNKATPTLYGNDAKKVLKEVKRKPTKKVIKKLEKKLKDSRKVFKKE